MPAMTVTATQGGSPANGMALRVVVITGAKPVASQTGGSAGTNFASGTAYTVSVTTTQTGSRVYGAGSAFTGSVSSTADTNTTLIDNILDATNTDNYVTFKGTSTTGTPGATTFGFDNTANSGSCGPAAYEVLVATTLAEDSSGSGVVQSTTSAQNVTTPSFTPPGGSLLVALVAANGSTGSETMSITDNLGTHLNWTEKVRNTSGAGNDYAGVWIADVPATGGPVSFPAAPGRTWLRRFHHPQSPPVASAVTQAAAPFVPQPLQPPFPQRPAPHRARMGALGAAAAGILAATTLAPVPASVPPARPAPVTNRHLPPHPGAWRGHAGPAPAVVPATGASRPQPVTGRPPPPHRAIVRILAAKTTLSPQPLSVPPARPQPVINRHLPPHRAAWDAVAGPPPAVQLGEQIITLLVPSAVSPRPPHRATAKGVLAPNPNAPQPSRVPPPQWRQPFAPRPAHRAVWRGIAGPAPSVVQAAPVVARPQPTVNRPPAPHRATGKGVLAVTTLSAQPSRVPPPAWRPQPRFVPPHRAAWRLVAGQPPAGPAPAAPSRPRPVTNRPPAPHRAVARWLLAKTTLSAQPSGVPAPHWQPQPRYRPPHRSAWRAITGPQPPPPVLGYGAILTGSAPGGNASQATGYATGRASEGPATGGSAG